MKKTITTLALSLFFISELVAFPIEKNGDMLSVTLLDVSKLEKEELASEFEGSPDGLKFIFVIEKQEGIKGGLSLKELTDFSVNGISYSSLNSNPIEPKSSLNAPSQLPEIDLSERTADKGDQITVMITRIAGSKLPKDSNYKVAVSLGLDGVLETFEYEFDKL